MMADDTTYATFLFFRWDPLSSVMSEINPFIELKRHNIGSLTTNTQITFISLEHSYMGYLIENTIILNYLITHLILFKFLGRLFHVNILRHLSLFHFLFLLFVEPFNVGFIAPQ